MCYAIKKLELMLRLSDYKFITISSPHQAVIKVVWICNPDNVNIRIYNPLCYKLYDFAGIIDVISALQMLIFKRFGVQIRNDKASISFLFLLYSIVTVLIFSIPIYLMMQK